MGTECRAFGMVPNDNLVTLAAVLRGLCFKYGALQLYEVQMKVPLMAGMSWSAIKLSRRMNKPDPSIKPNPFMEKLPDRWVVQHEGLPLRGPNINDLPASMREVCEATCFNDTTPDFWKALGAQLDYELYKRGNEYHCSHIGYEMKVYLFQLMTLTQPGNPDSAKVAGNGKWILDISTRVPEGKHVDGAKAVGLFAQRLMPLVTLQRAEMPIP